MSNYIIHNGELYHHGVKGMKWGVRRSSEVRSVNKAYKKELRDLSTERKISSIKNRMKYENSKGIMGETYSGIKYYKNRSDINKDYKEKKQALQEKYEPEFKKAQSAAEKRLSLDSKQTSTGKKVAIGVLAGVGATAIGAAAVFASKEKIGGLTTAEWVKVAVAARKL